MNTQVLSILVFCSLIAVTLIVTWYAGKGLKTDKDYYAAGRSIKGWQNGLAISGEFMTAAGLLGIAGLIAFYGIDAQIYSICWTATFFFVLILVAEKVRNTGKYTFADIVSYRLKNPKIRPLVSLTVLIVTLAYLIPQMVAAGALSRLLFGISGTVGIIIVGVLMIFYITVGGMKAATWIQSIKAVLMMSAGWVIALGVLSRFNFNVSDFFGAVENTKELAQHLNPGGWLINPIERYSLGFSLLFGTVAMPHVIMRFYTVPTKLEAQKSAFWTMIFMGIFHVTTFVLGLGAALLVGLSVIKEADAGGNLATPLLARLVGGDLFMSYVVAVAFITIIAAVSGLCLAASSAFSYDFWFNVVKKGNQTPAEQVKTARLSAIGIGLVAIVCSLALQKENVAYLTGLAFAIAATINLPALLFSLYWKKLTSKGVIIGIIGGTIVAILAVFLGPQVMGPKAIFPLSNPGIVTVPIGFLLTYFGSILTKDEKAEKLYEEISVRSHTGLGSAE